MKTNTKSSLFGRKSKPQPTPSDSLPVDIVRNTIAFSLLLEAKNCNPNGNPDANNEPRTNAWGYGQISDVCIKRMIRNAACMLSGGKSDDIFMLKGSTIVDDNAVIFEQAGVEPSDKITAQDQLLVQRLFCERFIDGRWFGAMLDAKKSDKARYNGGMLKGAVQIEFAESIDPVLVVSNTITRSKKTNASREQGNASEMGLKYMVDYGLYRSNGVISPYNAQFTYLTYSDVIYLFRCMVNMGAANLTSTKSGLRLRRVDVWVFPTRISNHHVAYDSLKISPVYDGNGEIKYPRNFADYDGHIELDEAKLRKYNLRHYCIESDADLNLPLEPQE